MAQELPFAPLLRQGLGGGLHSQLRQGRGQIGQASTVAIEQRVDEGPAEALAAGRLGRALGEAGQGQQLGQQRAVHPAARRQRAVVIVGLPSIFPSWFARGCGSTMRHISHIEQPQTIVRVLDHLGLPSEMPDDGMGQR